MIIFPLVYSTNLQFAYFITESVCLLIPFTWFTPTLLSHPVTTSCFIMSVSMFLFYLFVLFVSDSTNMYLNIQFICLTLTYFNKYNTLWVYPRCPKWQDFAFYGNMSLFISILIYLSSRSSLSVHL